jgi:hypothetical protein
VQARQLRREKVYVEEALAGMPRINILDEFEALGTELEPGGSANVAPA